MTLCLCMCVVLNQRILSSGTTLLGVETVTHRTRGTSMQAEAERLSRYVTVARWPTRETTHREEHPRERLIQKHLHAFRATH